MKTTPYPAIRSVEDIAGEREESAAVEHEGITAWANAQWADSAGRQAAGQEYADEGVYVFSEEEAQARQRNGGEVFIAPDGYVRRSPVQEFVVPYDYTQRRRRKFLMLVCGAVLAVLAVYLLLRLLVIRL